MFQAEAANCDCSWLTATRKHSTCMYIRQVAKVENLGLIARSPSKADKRVREATVTVKGQEMTTLIDAARERMATALLANWSNRDLQDLARLMRRFADDFSTVPIPGQF